MGRGIQKCNSHNKVFVIIFAVYTCIFYKFFDMQIDVDVSQQRHTCT